MNGPVEPSTSPRGFTRHRGEDKPVGRTRFATQTAIYTPTGWPESVRPPHSPGWEDSAAAFLLDNAPPEYRTYPVLRRHVVVLARFAAEHVESELSACQQGKAGMRASLGELVTPDVLEGAAEAWALQEAVLRRRRREIALVEEALRGKIFIRKL